MDILSTTLSLDKIDMFVEQLKAKDEPSLKRQKRTFKEAFERKFIKDPSISEGLQANL